MYRANFYGRLGNNSYLMRNWAPIEMGQGYDLACRGPFARVALSDGFFPKKSASSFERKLKDKMASIKHQEEELKQRVFALKDKDLAPNVKKEIFTTYARIKNSKKFMIMLLEQMQKATQNIAANFRT